MELYNKITKKIAEIRESILRGFNERSFYQINELMKLNEDFHSTMYAELGDIDRIANINKACVLGTGLKKDEKTGVSFCGQLLNLPVEEKPFQWKDVTISLLGEKIDFKPLKYEYKSPNDSLTDIVLAYGAKNPVESDDDFLERKISEGMNERIMHNVWQKSNNEHNELKDFLAKYSNKYSVDSPIVSFEINGEKFELNEGEGVEIENIGAITGRPISISSYVNHTAWENPKFVWQWERKSERQQKAILEILDSCNP